MANLSTSLKIDVSGFVNSIKQAVVSVNGLNTAVTKPMPVKVDNSQAKVAIAEVAEKVKEATSELGNIGKNMLGVFGGGVLLGGVSGIIGGFDKMVSKGKAAIEMQENMKLAFRASGLSVEEAEKAMSKNAKSTGELSDKYAVSKKDINEATAAFLRFGGSSDNLKSKQENIIGLAAKMGGNYELAARALAKATDPEIEGQLTKFGIKFEKNATEAERQKIITEKLGGTLKGLADKADTPLGKMQRVQNSIGGIASTIGVAIVESVAPLIGIVGDVVLPLITKIIGAIKSIIGGIKGFFTANSDAIKVVLTVIGTGAVIAAAALYGGLIPSVIASASAFITMGISAAAAWVAVNLPIIAIVAGIAALSAGIIYLYNNFEGVRKAVAAVKDIAVAVFSGLVQFAQDYWEVLKAVGEIFFNVMILPWKLLWAVLSPIFSMIGNFIGSFFNLGKAANTAGGAVDFIKKGFEVLHSVMSYVISALKGVIAGISTFAETATKVIDKVMHLDFSGAVDAAKEGGKKIGDSTANAFNDSMKNIKSEDAAKKFAEDFKKAAEEAKKAIASLDSVKLGEMFDDAKKKSEENTKAAIIQSSGLEVAAKKLRAVEKGNEEEKKKALAEFVKASNAVAAQDPSQAIKQELSYDEAIKLADATGKKLKKMQSDNFKESIKLQRIENSNSLENAFKEKEKANKNELDSTINTIEDEKAAREKAARENLLSELALNIELLKIADDANQKKIKAQIDAKNREIALKKQSDKNYSENDRIAAKIAIDKMNDDARKSATDTQIKINAEKGKFAIKEFEDAQKRQAELSKIEIEQAKILAEKKQGLEKKATNANDILKAIRESGEAKRRLIELQNEDEINQTIDKNAAVIKANEALKKAITSGDVKKIDTASAAVLDAINIAEKTDAAVQAVKIKNADSLIQIEKEIQTRISEAKINLIANQAERELQIKLLALEKQYDADMLLFRGNEQAKEDLKREYDAKRYDAELEAASKSRDMATIALNSIRDLGLGIAENIRSVMGNTFDDLNKAFDTFAGNIKKKIADSGEDNSAKTDEEGKKLIQSLKNQVISYQEFQAKSAELNKQRNADNVSMTERANLAIGLSFQGMAKTAQAGIDASLGVMATSAKAFTKAYTDTAATKKDKDDALEKGWKDFTANITDAGNSLVLNIGGVFGQLAAQGKLTLESAGRAAAGIALDTVSKIVMTQAPAILAIFTGSIPPPFGFIAGLAAIGAVQALLATTKAAIGGGFFAGGYTGDGSPRSVAGVVHGQEVVFESGITNGNKNELLALRSMMQNGTRLKDIIGNVTKSSTFVDASGKLQSSPSNIFSDYRANKRLQTAEFAIANTGKNAQSMEFATMQNSLKNIEKLLAKPSRQKTVSQVQINIEENPAFKAKQSAAALRLERARK